MKKVLITDPVHHSIVSGLQENGFQVDYEPTFNPSNLAAIVGQYTGMVINSKIKVTRTILELAPKLRFVARLGSGMEIIDRIAAAEHQVAIIGSPEGNRNAVAEHAVGMLLSLFNHLNRCDREVRAKIWRREANRGRELMGLTIGIIGFGHTGSQFAAKLAGFGVRVLAYDKYKRFYAEHASHVTETTLEQVLKESDVISFHLPLSEETRHLVDEAFLSQCRKGVILINTSRGQVIKTETLLMALESAQIGGACLDVFENEKPESFTSEEMAIYERLYAMDEVVLSPHVAGWTHESKERMAKVLLERILQLPDLEI